MTTTERLEQLEIKLAHLERGLQQLSDVVLRQQLEIDRALTLHDQLRTRLEALHEQGAAGDEFEVPPHY